MSQPSCPCTIASWGHRRPQLLNILLPHIHRCLGPSLWNARSQVSGSRSPSSQPLLLKTQEHCTPQLLSQNPMFRALSPLLPLTEQLRPQVPLPQTQESRHQNLSLLRPKSQSPQPTHQRSLLRTPPEKDPALEAD